MSEKVKCTVVGQIFGNDGKLLPVGSTVSVPQAQLPRLKGRVELAVDAPEPNAQPVTNPQKGPASTAVKSASPAKPTPPVIPPKAEGGK